MDISQTEIPGVLVITPKVFADSRGFFMETFQAERYADAGIEAQFVQDNFSNSQQGTVRGLHYQIEHPQGKLVQVVHGEVFDVAVDIRHSSPTFGKWVGVILSENNRQQLYIPPGCAHGFCVLSEVADFFYKCTDLYFPQHERTILWNDTEIGIDWPFNFEPILSEKDLAGIPFAEAECFD